MDLYTLVLACALVATIMTTSMGLLYLTCSRQACLLDWASAGACFALSSAIGAAATSLQSHHFLFPGIGNALYVAGHFGIVAGVRRQSGCIPGWHLMALAGVVIVAVHALPYVRDSVAHRFLLFTPVVAALNLAASWLLWRRPDREARLAGLPLVLIEVFFSLELALRACYLSARANMPLTYMGSQFLQTSGSLFVLVFLTVATMSCAQVVMQQQAATLRRASMTDVLTGWLNRRALKDVAAREFERCRRSGAALHMIAFDIDHFKAVNDRHGHAVGDRALCHVTALAADVVRGCDALFRTGGEEFAALLVGADAVGARRLAERLREQITANPLQTEHGAVTLTVSVGVAALDASDTSWEDVMGRTDAALYHAKQHGRDRVSVAHGAGLVRAQART